MKKWLPFFVVFALVFITGYFTASWATIALIILCLMVYYIRLYYRNIIVPTRHLKTLQKEQQKDE